MTFAPPPAVFKLGGSLFDLPDLRGRLAAVLAGTPRALIVAGGGGVAEAVRDLDRTHRLGEERAHRVACAALGVSARFVAELLPGGELVATRETASDVWDRGNVCVLDLPGFLAAEEPGDSASPHPVPPSTWDTTSDTLAAWVATRWPADRLVLLKSCDRSPGAVDPHFERFAEGLNVEWVNLRANVRPASGGRQPSVSSGGREHTAG